MKKKLVVHCKKEPFDVYVGRPGAWGNWFQIGRDGTREEVVAKFERWIRSKPEMVAKAKRELKGKVLGCWCSPISPCHAEVLVKIANERS